MAVRQDELISLSDDVDLARDRMLVERCQAGDAAAFGNLYARYYDRLLRFCHRRLSDRDEAEDAAQEAFARAWKALPRFAGERRFYPWLTVIAGNICTDTLRRRSRSTPTDEMELTAQHSVGAVTDDTCEELVLASVDEELVNRALERLSVRHRHVLAMREGSGWTYQQIADHEGVEIGTIETLLWRARQALKREYAIVCDSKGALAGFLVGAAAFLRRSVVRLAHRGSNAQRHGYGAGDLRNAIAVTGAAVAAAFIAPHTLAPRPTVPPAAAGAAIATPPLLLGHAVPAGGAAPATTPSGNGSGAAPASGTSVSGPRSGGPGVSSTAGGASSANGAAPTVGSLLGGTAPTAGAAGAAGVAGAAGGSVLHQAAGGVSGVVGSATSGVSGVVGGVAGTVGGAAAGAGAAAGGVTGGVAQTLNGVSQAIGLGSVLPGGSSGPVGSTSPASGSGGLGASGSGSTTSGGLTKVGSAASGLLGG